MNLDGREVSKTTYDEISKDIEILSQQNIIPGLGIILVGEKEDSVIYVNMKKKMCNKYGIKTYLSKFSEDTNESEIETEIKNMNNDINIHGILIQLPLPIHLNTTNLLNMIDVEKDVDGLGSDNLGKLAVNEKANFVPCTPAGCLDILDHYNIPIEGKHAVIIGKSRIVGCPLALMLMNRDATVSVCHIKTQNMANITKTADILFSGTGCPELIKENMVKKDSVVVDIGISKIWRNNKKIVVGDVDYNNVRNKVKYITPVPGGVGPMTIARLLKHTVRAAKKIIR